MVKEVCTLGKEVRFEMYAFVNHWEIFVSNTFNIIYNRK